MYRKTINHPHYANEDNTLLPERMQIDFYPLQSLAEETEERIFEARITVTSPVGEPCIFRLDIEFYARAEGDAELEGGFKNDDEYAKWLEQDYQAKNDKVIRDAFGVPYNRD